MADTQGHRPIIAGKSVWFIAVALLAGALALGFFLFGNDDDRDGDRADIGAGNASELIVLTVRGPATYRERDGQVTGYEYALTSRLGDDLGLDVRYEIHDSLGALTQAIDNNEGHIAAAGLTGRERTGTQAANGPAYKAVTPQIVCKRGSSLPTGMDDLKNVSFAVTEGSGGEELLFELSGAEQAFWQRRDVTSAMPLLTEVSRGTIDCTLAESHIIALARLDYPDLAIAFPLGEEDRQLAWLIAPEAEILQEFLPGWMQSLHEDGTLEDFDERFFGHLDDFDYLNITTFRKRIDTRLPDYEDYFRDAADMGNLDWTLLAAQGYQESHWDPEARSPTGVRGLMMLTLPTARELGVENRLDPVQSIYGGADYMDRLYNRLPDAVTGYDRLWMAMAAYNVGYGHLLDARRLADRRGQDKNKWRVIDDMLPLLTKSQYYSTVPHGYARGYEPVHYVRRIREYDDILTNNIPNPEQPPFIIEDTGDTAVADTRAQGEDALGEQVLPPQ
ncbi:membrane-bound lytic murein transglycosylase MltF [Aquisalinus flavus]|uniref:Membrane-bound lytic murein transglycosylase F n=1 Tax=Aquisalinus flavus TaxID=1526572 RepID=A0A8J2Y894_9PROT|nr:membrane-bound lytic murein transglycosylase MltF [Aquisalinus flavus]MBD0425381.1 membrane-bound lytic murein transglycosylase MltF [Aquisalinus flavus]UNE48970.1 membrane-bound lytic murein transglycosylase MltF [Aquisalinus flavus]GGD16515.1 membrane-bound lytic murein transglycosylase F [Aquisalinus flavus]